ncbi:hypothetical protein [Longimicrobium sp.]|jgi:transposase|uniref:hypothetical protein n=1 Tax=Longimicrobium sp. TaxID=2029185 RepID=UPI002EDA7420
MDRSETFLNALIGYYRKTPLVWGGIDLFLVPGDGALARMCDYAAVFRAANDGQAPASSQIWLVWPDPAEEGALLASVRTRLGTVWERSRGAPPTPTQLDGLLERVRIVIPESYDVDGVSRLIGEAGGEAVLVVGRASVYRSSQVERDTPADPMPGDEWAPHLHALMGELREQAAAVGCYVVLDVEEALPERKALSDLLLTVENTAVISFEETQARSLPREAIQRWRTLAAEADLDTALVELNAEPTLSERDKSLLRLQLYGDAGNRPAVRAGLEANRDLLPDLEAEQALQVAVLAEESDADDVATELLSGSLERLHRPAALELALQVAGRLRHAELVRRAQAALEAANPDSPVLRRHRAARLAAQHRYREAAQMLEGDQEAEIVERAAFWTMLSDLEEDTPVDARTLIDAVSERLPARAGDARRLAAARLAEEGSGEEALALLLLEPAPHLIDRADAFAVLEVLERSALRGVPIIDEAIAYALERVIEPLSARPTDASLRFRLLQIIGPEVFGLRGIGLLALVLGTVAGRPVRMGETRRRVPLDPSLAEEAVSGFLHRGYQWLKARSPMMIGSQPIPADLLGIPADQAFAAVRGAAEQFAEEFGGTDRRPLNAAVAMVAATAPVTSTPDEDLLVIRQVGMRLAQNGSHQYARDWAEQVLALAGDDPFRARLAWTAFAEIYARTGHIQEAMLGIFCAFAAHDETTWEDVWHESQLAYRLLRETGLLQFARPFLDTGRLALQHLGLEVRFGSRLETGALQVEVWEYLFEDVRDAERLRAITGRAHDNLRRVLESRDESAPATSLLASALRLCAEQGVEAPADARPLLEQALQGLDGRLRGLIELEAASAPDLRSFVEIARGIERARYSEDVGYDIRQLLPLAERLLAGEGAVDAVAAAYAIEVLADRASPLAGDSEEGPAGERLIGSADGPARAAGVIARADLAVLAMGLAKDRLIRVTAMDGELQRPVAEEEDTFSADRLSEWSAKYPYEYAAVRDSNEFFTSTGRIGVTEMPERAVIVASTDLQRFPPNLLHVQDEFAGWTRRLAAAPSLTWLESARRNPFTGDGRRLAWIPLEGSEDPLDPLNVVAGELEATLAQHGTRSVERYLAPGGRRGRRPGDRRRAWWRDRGEAVFSGSGR